MQPALWNDDVFNNSAQPVVGVCWHEARAYCAWLSAQTGLHFRLPTEAEWETAARERQGWRYAYGDDFDATRCNTFETHIRRTTPIGVFPGGETSEGLIDMTGNVWEWTSSLYKPYRYDASDGREEPITGNDRRVLRGGSWLYYPGPGLARTVSRHNLLPDHRSRLAGFRLVCSSPPQSLPLTKGEI
jgi:formylglycine-generating enzyme required for sulfatase activity